MILNTDDQFEENAAVRWLEIAECFGSLTLFQDMKIQSFLNSSNSKLEQKSLAEICYFHLLSSFTLH